MLRYCCVFFPLLMALSPPATLPAQEQPASPQRPVHRSDQVQTTDPIALLAVNHHSSEAPAHATPNAVTPAPADEASRTAALASIDKQIKEKQDHIILLLRLFVDDEKKFVIDPTNPQVDPAIKERRKYEQDELLYETAELAKLKATRAQLTAGH
jgi:hypothetical protein